jgi:hypothetical protein
MDDREITREYYLWLCGLVKENDRFGKLLSTLYGRVFLHSIPNDENRAFEGVQLRGRFCQELSIDYDPKQFLSACSMLEMIIALAYRCENIMSDQLGDFTMRDWFWRLLSNLMLDGYDDEHFDDSTVNVIINKIIDRSYKRNGEGGLFPLKFNKKDQRRVELWYQMNEYLMENYFT